MAEYRVIPVAIVWTFAEIREWLDAPWGTRTFTTSDTPPGGRVIYHTERIEPPTAAAGAER